MSAGPVPGTTRDAFYGGRLLLTQPARGHRSGTDAVLLAAAVPLGFAGLCYDVGSGVGAVGLGVALLRPGARVVLVEREAATVALARANAAAMGREVTVRREVTVAECDVLDREALRRVLPVRADLVVTNPPFHDPSRGRASPDPLRRAAHVLEDGVAIEDWVLACLDRLDDKGTLIAIHVAAALPSVLAAFAGRFGAVVVKPVLPRVEAPAHRVLVQATRNSRAPFTLAPPLVLHDGNGRFTPEAVRLHRGEAALDW